MSIKFVNFFGPPGIGKSTVALGVTWLLKSHHVRAELVTEYAKQLVHEGQSLPQLLERRQEILEVQHYRQDILRGHYDFAISDSPLPFCAFYNRASGDAAFQADCARRFAAFDNLNFFLSRDLSGNAAYDETGRVHDRAASDAIGRDMQAFLAEQGIVCQPLTVSLATPWEIAQWLAPQLQLANPFSARAG